MPARPSRFLPNAERSSQPGGPKRPRIESTTQFNATSGQSKNGTGSFEDEGASSGIAGTGREAGGKCVVRNGTEEAATFRSSTGTVGSGAGIAVGESVAGMRAM